MDPLPQGYQESPIPSNPTSPAPDGGSPNEPIVCNGTFLTFSSREKGVLSLEKRSVRVACKQGLEETQDNTVVSFGKYLFQYVIHSLLFIRSHGKLISRKWGSYSVDW